jgi:hypothetical protein
MNTNLTRSPAWILVCLAIGLPAQAQVPNVANSYFYPQAGSVASPLEGTAATEFFRACPNNDGGSSLPLSARIKIVLRDNANAPIVGVAAANIYMLFNGGTATQGFGGDGADSIIANGIYNTNPACPNVTTVNADSATNTAGETYITFTGANPLFPGVGVRDSNRKWGHYDSDIPVYANGVRLSGRVTPAGSNGDYLLRIKNFDFRGGLANGNNQGEVVSNVDYNAMSGGLGDSDDTSFWRDFDQSGVSNITDFNMFVKHRNHDCGTGTP